MNFTIELPQVETKPLTPQQKKWALQNDLFELLKHDDELKRENWRRYVRFLKKYRLPQAILGIQECQRRWKSCKDKDLRKIKPIYNSGHKNEKRTLGFFTAHLNEEALWYVLSVCNDKLNRGESPTCYIYSLNKFSTISTDLLQKSS